MTLSIACSKSTTPSDGSAGDSMMGDAMADATLADSSLPDASVGDTGAPDGSVEPPAACTELCGRIGECTGEPEDPGCVTECTADLLDCSAAEIATLRACGEAADACAEDPATMGPSLASCVGAVPCVDSGP